MRVLQELFYGNIDINGRKIPPDSRLAELSALVTKNDERFQKMLSDDIKEKYNIYSETQNELFSEFECEAFISGFALGLRITLESLYDKNF